MVFSSRELRLMIFSCLVVAVSSHIFLAIVSTTPVKHCLQALNERKTKGHRVFLFGNLKFPAVIEWL